MKVLLISVTLLLNSIFSFAQNESCKCAKNNTSNQSKPDTVFCFSNQKKISLFGYIDRSKRPYIFSESALAECGKDSILDSWDATINCEINMRNDTLIINELKKLPVGKDLTFIETIWTTENIYYKGEYINIKATKNSKIPKYSKSQITKVLNDYKRSSGEIDDQKMDLVNRLFVAAISGNATARAYFHEFSKKYSLDGAFAEDYKDLEAMLEFWDKN